MESLTGPEGPILPSPDAAANPERLARTQSAVELFRACAERTVNFAQRVEELGRSGVDTVITLIDADDPDGGILADALMPEHDWQRYRDAGEMPVAHGLMPKAGLVGFLQAAGHGIAALELAEANDLKVVVLHAGVVLVLDANLKAS